MYIAILGRQPEISLAELSRSYDHNAKLYSKSSAVFDCSKASLDEIGGSLKIGNVIKTFPKTNWQILSDQIINLLVDTYSGFEGKLTLGLSVYDYELNPRDVQYIGIKIKSKLKSSGVSLRLIPNQTSSLSTATSFNNKLGLSPNKKEIFIIHGLDDSWILAESLGVQNIKSYSLRDYNRPKRDMYVGMLPPKLAQIMINLACQNSKSNLHILDPFCGTGVVLQEASLKHYTVQGTDLSSKMVQYSTINLDWLKNSHNISVKSKIYEGNAVDTKWQQPIDAVVSEIYLGQPFSAPPSPAKLEEVKNTCSNILNGFLKNIHSQIKPGTPICLAIPAWRMSNQGFSKIPTTERLDKLGYKLVDPAINNLIYHRPDQIVGRQLLLITKK